MWFNLWLFALAALLIINDEHKYLVALAYRSFVKLSLLSTETGQRCLGVCVCECEFVFNYDLYIIYILLYKIYIFDWGQRGGKASVEFLRLVGLKLGACIS